MKMVFSKRPDQVWQRRNLDGREIVMRVSAVGVACFGLALMVLAGWAFGACVMGMTLDFHVGYVIGMLVFAGLLALLGSGTAWLTIEVWRDEL